MNNWSPDPTLVLVSEIDLMDSRFLVVEAFGDFGLLFMGSCLGLSFAIDFDFCIWLFCFLILKAYYLIDSFYFYRI